MSSKSSFYNSTGVTNTQSNAIEASVDNAEASATASENSANSASASASTATTKASEASTSASTATTKASEASTSASTATTKASEASTSAATATTKATESATSATASANSATSASASASTATTKASEASSSASTALSHKNDAQTAKTAAETAETNAETAETNAASSATAASTSASSASTSASTATTKAGEASTSASTATTKAGEASTSASNANTAALTATTKASEASTSATNAASSATAASASKDAALAALDSFDDRYLGVKSSNPTVDNDGNTLVAGSLYFNSTDDTMKVYEGSAWVAAYASLSGAVLQTGGTMTGNLSFGDNDKAIFGAGSDLQIYHNGSNSFIDDAGTGNLQIRASSQIKLQKYTGENIFVGIADGAASMYYDNSQKIATTSSGISVTGNANFADNGKAIFGAGSDLQIYHDGSHSIIKDAGAGYLKLGLSDQGTAIQNTAGNNLLVTDATDVSLRHNGSEKLTTTSTGIDVTGTVTSDGLTVDKEGTDHLKITDTSSSNTLTVGIGNTVGTIAIDPTNTVASSKLDFSVDGNTAIRIAEGGDISFYEDTGTTAKFFWDASAESLGLGTSSPQYLGHFVDGDVAIVDTDATNNAEKQSLLFGGASGESAGLAGITGYRGASSNYGELLFKTNNGSGVAERMRITSSGNVGIGTDSPDKLLHIERNDTSTSASFKIKNSGTGDATVQLGTSTTNVVFGVDNSDGDKFKLGFGSALQSAGDLTLDSNGNVGIGTSSPDSNAGLEVYGKRLYVDAADNYALRLEKSSVVGGYIGAPALSNLAFYSSGGSERMRIDSSGNVGIGRSSTLRQKLHIQDSSAGIELLSDTTGQSLIHFGDTSNFDTGAIVYDHPTDSFRFDTADTERLRIDSSGNVGINDTAPSSLLQLTQTSDDATGGLQIRNTADSNSIFIYQDGNVTTYDAGSSGEQAFKTGNTEACRIDSSGNVLVGKSDDNFGTVGTAINQVGEVQITRASATPMYIRRNTNDGELIGFYKDSTAVGSIGSRLGANLLLASNGGSVYTDDNFRPNADNAYNIGLSSLRFKDLHLSGTAYSGHILAGATAQIGTGSNLIKADGDTLALDVYTSTSTAGRDVFAVRSDIGGTETKVGVIEANGDFQSATNSYGSISDQSVKQDIVDANSQMEDVKNIRLRNYRLIDHVTAYGDDAKVHLGVVAQELEAENMNGLVSENADGVKGVRYSVMLLKALGALQETITMVEDLQAENTQIKARLTALEG